MLDHMSATAHADHSHGTSYYVKIWALLLGLLVVSIMGPMIGVKILTLITAFGIAIVKALIVAAYFMHLKIERRYIWYMLYTMLILVFLFFVGVASDVMKHDGRNWTNKASTDLIEEHKEGSAEHGSVNPHGE
jgi:caa(3)-type oxidase subunit IV